LFVLVCSIFIFLSRESDVGAIFWTNSHSLKKFQFPSFPVGSLTLPAVNLRLLQIHQAEIIVVKRCIQWCSNTTYEQRWAWTESGSEPDFHLFRPDRSRTGL